MTKLLRLTAAGLAAGASIVLLGAPVDTAPAREAGDRFSVSAARGLRGWDRLVDSMQRQRELRRRAVQDDTLVAGRLHERLDQYYKGVRVFGADVVRETDGAATVGLTGNLYRRIVADTTPLLEPEDALAVFAREAGTPAAPRTAPELVILPTDDGRFVLAYRVTAFVRNHLPVIFVNARTGAVELRYDDLKTQESWSAIGRGYYGDEKKVSGAVQGGAHVLIDMLRPTRITTYDLKGNLSRMLLIDEGLSSPSASEVASAAGTTLSDPVAVDVHTYLGWTYDYLYKRFGQKGTNGRDSRSINAIVHPVLRSDLAVHDWEIAGSYYLNAFFCGYCAASGDDVLMFGEGLPSGYYLQGSGQYVTYYGVSLDIVAHEYVHAVTQYSSNLIYRLEPGALNESFSDVLSLGAEFYWQAPGSGALKAEYLEGEDTYVPGQAGSAYGMRSFSDPRAYGHPDHYSKRYTGTSDNGGVHTNSSIPNHAFYLAIEGGTNRTSGLAVHGVGAANRAQIERVFFRAFTTLPSNASFSQAREKTIESARELYGAGGAVETAVTEAWTAVGVE